MELQKSHKSCSEVLVGSMASYLKPRLHDTTGCQTGLYNRFDNRLYTRYSRLSNRLSNGFDSRWMFVYTIQPVVKPVWQPVVSCIQTFNRLLNRFDKRLYRVNGALARSTAYSQFNGTSAHYRPFSAINGGWLQNEYVMTTECSSSMSTDSVTGITSRYTISTK